MRENNRQDELMTQTPFDVFANNICILQNIGCSPYRHKFTSRLALQWLFFQVNAGCIYRFLAKCSGLELALLNIILLCLDSVERFKSEFLALNSNVDPPQKPVTINPITPQAPPVTAV